MKDEFHLLRDIEKAMCDEFYISKEDFKSYLENSDGSIEDLYNTIKENTLYKFTK